MARTRWFEATVMALALLAPSAAAAQGAFLDEIIVTAQKRAENVQDVPIAITAISSQTLEDSNIRDISELPAIAPNLVFDTTAAVSGSSASAAVFIRGVGQTDYSLSTEPGVGIYVDGVYMARSIGGVLDVLDLERVEVLRGPQGTLFGRNTIGGAISLITKQPSFDGYEGRIEVTAGNRERLDIRGHLNLPISDRVAARVSVSSKNQDGFVKGLLDDRELGDVNRDSLRVQILAELSDRLTLRFSADGTRIREQNAPQELVGATVDDGSTLGNPSLSFLYNVFDAPVTDIPGFGFVPYDDRWVTPELDTTYETGPNRSDLDVWGADMTLEWDVSETITLKSITAYRETTGVFNSPEDGSPLVIAHALTQDYEQTQFTQELQATGTSFEGALNWVLGGYYLNEDGFEDQIVSLVPSFGSLISDQEHSTRSFAAYAQGTYAVTDTVNVTGGVRYTRDKKTNLPVDASITLGIAGAFAFGLAPGDVLDFVPPGEEVEATFEEVSPRFAIDWSPVDDLLLYASYSRGFKSGGFNIRYLVPRGEVLGYDPETLTTYEGGVKWTGFDQRLRANLAGYFSKWKDLQVVVFEDFGAPLVQNAGEAEIAGAEVEMVAAPIEGLTLSGSVGYTDAKYTDINNPTTSIPTVLLVTTERELPNAPEWTANLMGSYDFPVDATGGLVTFQADWSYVSAHFNDAINSEFLDVDEAVNRVNLSLRYRPASERWSITAFVQNVTDERYITAGQSNFPIGFHNASYNRPRDWGVKLTATF